MKKKQFVAIALTLFLVNLLNAQINGNLFKWQGNLSSSWSNSLNWQVWDTGTSSWVVNSLATIPNSTTHTVTVDFTSATTKTVNVDISTGNADVGQIFIINNASAQARFEIKSQNTLSVYNTFSVSGTATSSISIYCSSAASTGYKSSSFAGGLSGGGVIVFKPSATTTITPIFASATFSNVGLAVNGLGTTDITENNITVQGFFHQLGIFNLVGKTFNCISSVQFEPINISSDVGFANLLGSTINTQSVLFANTALYNFAAQTTTFNLNGVNTTYNSCDILYNGNTLSASVATVSAINIIGNKPSNFMLSGTTNCSKNVIINNLTTSEELIFNSNGGVCEYHIKNLSLTRPLIVRNISVYTTFKDLETITTAPSSCVAAYHFISQNDQVDISTNGPINVNNMNFFNAKVSSGSITSTGGFDMGYNSGITFVSAPISLGTTTLTWNGSSDDKWTNPLNWTPNCVPTILTNVIIPSGTPNQANLVTSSGICYNFNSTGSPTVSIYNNMTLIVGGNFIRNTGTIFNLATSVSTQANINISLLGVSPNTTYSITSNNCLLPNYALNINANQNGVTYQLTDKFSVNYPGNNNSNFLNLVTGRLFSNGFGIETKGISIRQNNIATSTRSLNIANSIINISNYNIGYPFYLNCSNTNEFNTIGSSIYFQNNPSVPTSHIIYIANLPANNHLANPSFGLNRVVFEGHPLNVGQFSLVSAGTNTSLASGFKVNSIKALGGMVISSSSIPKNVLNIDSLYLTGGFSLIGPANNSITVNNYISSTANCQTGAFSIMSSNVGLAATNQFYINTGPSFSFTPLDYWNIDAVRVNQGTGGIPAITVNNANLSANSGISPSNGWNSSAYIPKIYYWVGEGITTNWSDIDNWSYSIPTNGDEPTAGCLPTIYDDVLFTKLSFFGNTGSSISTTSIVMVDKTVSFKDMRWLGPFNTTISGTTPLFPMITNTIMNNEMNASGSIRMHQTMKWNFGNTSSNSNNVRFTSAINDTIEMQNNSFGSNIYFNGSGRYAVIDSLVLSGVRTNTLNPVLLPGIIIHQNGELDLEGHKLFACGYQSSAGNASSKLKFNITNSKLTFIQISYGGTIFGNSVAGTYTLNAANSIINIKPYNDYCCSGIHNTYLGLVTPIASLEPRLSFNVINISSFSPSNTVYKVEANGKGVDIDSLTFNVSNTYLYNTVATQTNTINYLKYKVGSTNQLTSGATTLLQELNAVSVCDPIIIQSSIVGSNVNICPSSTLALQASQTSLKYINSACGAYVSPNYNMVNGSLSSFIPNGTENGNGWSINTIATPLGFISQKSGTTTCSQLPYTINASEFNASITTHTLIWQSANGTYTGTPSNGLDLTTFSTTANGVHTLTVVYKTGCVVVDTYTLNIANDVTSVYSSTNVICNGGNNGSFSVAATTGTLTNSSYNYLISPGNYTTNAVTSLTPSIYSYTITNTVNPKVCRSISTFTITEPNILSVNILSTQSVSCFGASSGSVTTNITGGNGGNIFNWTNSSFTYTTQNINAVLAGTYSLTVIDSKSCTTTNTVQVTEPLTAVTSTLGTLNNVNCFGGTTTISINASGGTGTLTYSWMPNGGVANTATIASGNYTITTTDANNCRVSNTLSITQPTQALALSSITNNTIACNGGTINVIANVTGGTSPYNFNWQANASTTNTANYQAGTYSVILTDANNCSATAQTFTVNQPASLTITSVNINTINCFGNSTGSVTTSITGGNGGNIYNWTNGASTYTTQNINSVPAGNYTLTLIDSKTCATSTVISLNEPSTALTSALGTVSNVNCFGATTTVTTNASGGTGAATFSWMPSGGTANTATLTAGNYTVITQDANDCRVSSTLSVTQPTQALVLSSITNNTIACNGGTTNVVANVTGGTSPYNFNWQANASTINTANYQAGTYTVLLTDANSCTVTVQMFTITEPQPLTLQLTNVTNISCNTLTASVSYTATGGTTVYSYSFITQNGTLPTFTTNATNATNLTADSYSISLIDANGCNTYTTFAIANNSNPPQVGVVTQSVSCNGGNNGSATASVTSASTYTYLWSNGLTTNGINNLNAGSYSVTVTDINNCITIHTISITEPNAIVVSEQSNSPSCDNTPTGEITLTILGGVPSYSVLWSNGSNGKSINQLPTGAITATVTDANGCIQIYNTIVNEEKCLVTFIPQFISPNGDGKNESFFINTISYYPNNKLGIFNRWGNLIYSKNKYDNTFNGVANVSNAIGNGLLPSGTYFVVFDFGDASTPVYKGYLEIKY